MCKKVVSIIHSLLQQLEANDLSCLFCICAFKNTCLIRHYILVCCRHLTTLAFLKVHHPSTLLCSFRLQLSQTRTTFLPLLSFSNDIQFKTLELEHITSKGFTTLIALAMVHFLHAGQYSLFCQCCSGHQSTYCRLFSFLPHQSQNELLIPVGTLGSTSHLQWWLKILFSLC